MPADMRPLMDCISARVSIADVFPQSTCAIQFDPTTLTLRWSLRHFVSMLTVVEIQLIEPKRRLPTWRNKLSLSLPAGPIQSLTSWPFDSSKNVLSGVSCKNLLNGLGGSVRSPRERDIGHKTLISGNPVESSRSPGRVAASDAGRSDGKHASTLSKSLSKSGSKSASSNGIQSRRAEIQIDFVDIRGVSRVLVLSMSTSLARAWHKNLTACIAALPRTPYSISHWRWALTCMEATSEGDAFIRRSEFHSFCERANTQLDEDLLEEELRTAEVAELP
eukprot:1778509-Prymnesium_polylepis.1